MYSSRQASDISTNHQDWIGKHVLIVEDTIDNFLYLKIVLKGFGFNLHHAETAKQAMAALHANPEIILVLMDIQLPDDSGLNVTKKMKEGNPDLIIVAQTAYAMAEDEKVCLEAGCDDYLPKPISSASLYRVMKKHLG